ncbi:MBG domain-containing protein, partial [Oxalobacteraceae bacterium A2-2]
PPPPPRWQVYADTWVGETRGGLGSALAVPNHYHCAYGAACAASLTGDGFIYRAQPTVTVTGSQQQRTYGEANPALGYAVSGLVNGDTTANSLSGGFTTAATSTSGVGTYGTTGMFSSATGYLVQVLPGALTVAPAVLTYIANPAQQYAGAAAPSYTGSVSGFVLGETLASATTGTLVFTTTATAASPPGSYALQGGGLNAQNYRFVQAAGNASALQVLPGYGPLAALETERPTILRDVTFETSNVYTNNVGSPRVCVATGTFTGSALAGDDALGVEWARVKVSPNLSNCLSLGQRNSCQDF